MYFDPFIPEDISTKLEWLLRLDDASRASLVNRDCSERLSITGRALRQKRGASLASRPSVEGGGAAGGIARKAEIERLIYGSQDS